MSKKIIKFLAFFMAAVVLCSCSPKGKGGTGEGSDPVGKEAGAGDTGKDEDSENGSGGSPSWKRTVLSGPEGAARINSVDHLADGTVRIYTSGQDFQNSGAWDSKDNGSSWENAGADLSLLTGNEYGFGFSKEGNLYAYDNESLTLPAGDGTGVKTLHANPGEEFAGAAAAGNTAAVLVANSESWKLRVEIYDLRTMECRQVDNPQLSECLNVMSAVGANIALNRSGDVMYLAGGGIGLYGSGIVKYDLNQDQFSYLMEKEAAETMMNPKEDSGLMEDPGIVQSFSVNDTEDQVLLCVMKPTADKSQLYLCEWGNWEEEKQAGKGGKLRIYSLKQSYVWQAASYFQENHPEWDVSFEVGYTGEDGVTLSDAIRTLNTELMAGEGPDVLILDGMPADSYIEKGILEDLTDIVEPEKEKYFYNIISAYNDSGNIYQLPTNFIAPVLVGDGETTAAKNREELMEVLKKKSSAGIPFIPFKNYSSAAVNLFITSDILGETLDEEKLAEYYRDLKTIADLCYSEEELRNAEDYKQMLYHAEFVYPTGGGDADLDIYFDHAQAGIEKISFLDCYTQILTVSKEKGMSYTYLNQEGGNYFIAADVLGVNRHGKNPEAAKQFVREYMEGELQTGGPAPSLAVNRGLLWYEKMISEEGEYMGGTSGKYTPDEVMPLYKITPAEMQELTAFLEGLDTPVKDDAVVLQKVMEQADACVFEGKDPESAAKDACSGVNLYLSE